LKHLYFFIHYATDTNHIYTLSLHDALPILGLDKNNIKEIVIKVNGKIITSDEFLIGEDGKIKFDTELKKDDKVKIDYVLKEKTVEYTYPGDEDKPLKNWSIGATFINSATISIGKRSNTIDSNMANDVVFICLVYDNYKVTLN